MKWVCREEDNGFLQALGQTASDVIMDASLNIPEPQFPPGKWRQNWLLVRTVIKINILGTQQVLIKWQLYLSLRRKEWIFQCWALEKWRRHLRGVCAIFFLSSWYSPFQSHHLWSFPPLKAEWNWMHYKHVHLWHRALMHAPLNTLT